MLKLETRISILAVSLTLVVFNKKWKEDLMSSQGVALSKRKDFSPPFFTRRYGNPVARSKSTPRHGLINLPHVWLMPVKTRAFKFVRELFIVIWIDLGFILDATAGMNWF